MKLKSVIKHTGIERVITIVLFMFMIAGVSAQQAAIIIETKSNALVLQADSKGELNTQCFEKKLINKFEYSSVAAQYKQGQEYTGVTPSAYTTSGTKNLFGPAIIASCSRQPVLLTGLDPDAEYRIEEVHLFPGAKSSINPATVYSGDFLMDCRTKSSCEFFQEQRSTKITEC